MTYRWMVAAAFLLAAGVMQAGAEDVLSIAGFPPGANVGMIGSDKVRLRSGPSTTAAVLQTMNTGELVVIEGQSDAPTDVGDGKYYWEHVKLADGREGWAYGEFVYNPLSAVTGTVGSRTYTAVEFWAPTPEGSRGMGGPGITLLVDGATRQGLRIRIPDSAGFDMTNQGWLDVSLAAYDDPEMTVLDSIGGSDERAPRLVLVHKKVEGQDGMVPVSRITITCQRPDGGKAPWFLATKVETAPVN